jgi:hypothetical protein
VILQVVRAIAGALDEEAWQQGSGELERLRVALVLGYGVRP